MLEFSRLPVGGGVFDSPMSLCELRRNGAIGFLQITLVGEFETSSTFLFNQLLLVSRSIVSLCLTGVVGRFSPGGRSAEVFFFFIGEKKQTGKA